MTDPRQPTSPLHNANEVVTGGPIDDPATASRGLHGHEEPTAPHLDAQPMINPDGSPDVMPPHHESGGPGADAPGVGTRQDPMAQELPGDLEPGTDNIRLGRGDSSPNPALAEGGNG